MCCQITWSMLAQVMACCLMAPSYYLTQWLCYVLVILKETPQPLITEINLKEVFYSNFNSHLPGTKTFLALAQNCHKYIFLYNMILWQIGPNLSSGIRWCLALASVRQLWCLLWHVWCVCMCVCRVNGGPDLVCVMKACLIRVICVNCGIRNLGIYQMLRISGTCNVCSSCVLWLDLSPAWVVSVSKWGC